MLQTSCTIALMAAPLVLTDAPAPPAAAPESTTAIVVAALPAAPTESRATNRTARAESESAKSKYKFEAVEYKTRDKQMVHAAFFAPRKKGKSPAALLVHDAGGESTALYSLADNLQRKGFAVLVPDLRGHGESITESCDWSKTTDAEAQMRLWNYSMRDLEASTEYLRNQDRVHNANLSMVGVGAGSLLAARYAIHDENARSVVVIEPQDESYGFNMGKDIIELGGLPVLIMATKEGRQLALRIKDAAANGNDGLEYVSVKSLKPKEDDDIFSDRRLAGEVTKFLREEAMPKR